MENKFVIKWNTWGDQTHYASHGEFGGKKDVMSYTTKKNAMRFNTEEEAMNHIENNLPFWTKKERYIVEVLTPFDQY